VNGPAPTARFFLFKVFAVLFALLVVMAALYAWSYWSFWNDRPQLKRNYTAEINAPIAKIPQSERAWPRYRQALVKLKGGLGRWRADEIDPAAEAWPEIVQFVAAHQDAIHELREAAKLPHLGHVYADAVSAEDAQLEDEPDLSPPSDNPNPIFLLLTPQDKLREAALFLMADARLAADADDSARVMSDVVAALSIARHMQQPPFAACQLQSWGVVSSVCALLGELLTADPGLFSDEQLAALDRCLRDFAAAGFSIGLALERITMDDVEQRWFTDDGAGDGHLYPELEGGEPLSIPAKAVLPLRRSYWRDATISRREYREKIAALFDSMQKELAQPAWNNQAFSFARELHRLSREQRWSPVTKILPDMTFCYFQSHRVAMQLDATRVVIALARYRRRHGAWPETLDKLVPDFLDELPPDRFDGKPLRYRPHDGQPIVYSVGLDRDDDSAGPMPAKELPDLVGLWSAEDPDPAQVDGDLLLWPAQKPPPSAETDAGDEQADR
jgi:hypothetical protein